MEEGEKRVWHVVENPDKIEIYLITKDGVTEKIEIEKKDPDFDKKIKNLAKMKEFELLRKHYKIHHGKELTPDH